MVLEDYVQECSGCNVVVVAVALSSQLLVVDLSFWYDA